MQGEGIHCITDRKPCCKNSQFSAGEWLFPNGSNIPTQDSAAVFYRDRGDDGSVILSILSSDIDIALPLLTGLFCCVVPDATDTTQTVCADISKFLMSVLLLNSLYLLLLIELTFSAEISSTGAAVVGLSYSLHCNVAGTERFTPILSYKWIKNNGTLTHVGFDLENLSYSPLRLSNAGQYVCHITASSDVTNEQIANTSSQSFEVSISSMCKKISDSIMYMNIFLFICTIIIIIIIVPDS